MNVGKNKPTWLKAFSWNQTGSVTISAPIIEILHLKPFFFPLFHCYSTVPEHQPWTCSHQGVIAHTYSFTFRSNLNKCGSREIPLWVGLRFIAIVNIDLFFSFLTGVFTAPETTFTCTCLFPSCCGQSASLWKTKLSIPVLDYRTLTLPCWTT